MNATTTDPTAIVMTSSTSVKPPCRAVVGEIRRRPIRLEVGLDEPEVALDARLAVRIAELVRGELEVEPLAEHDHLLDRLHLLAGAAPHDHVRVVDDADRRGAVEVPQRLGEEDLAREAIEAQVVLEEEHPRPRQHERRGLHEHLRPRELDHVRRSVVLHLPAGLVLVSAHGRFRLVTDPVAAAEFLREGLRCLDLRGQPGRAENRQVAFLEFVHDPEREGQLRAHDRQVHL